jgi:hypothetical protein
MLRISPEATAMGIYIEFHGSRLASKNVAIKIGGSLYFLSRFRNLPFNRMGSWDCFTLNWGHMQDEQPSALEHMGMDMDPNLLAPKWAGEHLNQGK